MTETTTLETPVWLFHTMPLNIFIDQVDNGTVDPLIYTQFLDAIKDKEQSLIQKMIKEINLLEFRYNGAQTAIKYYELINDPAVFEVIIKLVVSAQITDTLQIIITRTGKMLTDLEAKKKELQLILPPDSGAKHDRKYFSYLTLQVSKHLKFQVNKYKTSVGEFADMINDLRETSEAMEKEFKKAKNAK